MPLTFRPLLVLVSVLGLGGCALSTPFTRGVVVADTAEVVVAVTYAKYRPDEADEFWRLTKAVQATLPQQSGLVGYRLRRQIFGNEAWTMTVWTDAQALEAFVASPTHRVAMRATGRLLEDAKFVRLTVRGSDLPLAWDKALVALAESGNDYSRPPSP